MSSISPATKPCLAAAILFAAIAALISHFAIAPFTASDLLGISACAAAAGAFATLAFTLGPAPSPSATPSPTIDADALAVQIAAAVDTRLAASEDRRREELLRAATSAATSSLQPAASSTLDADAISAPAGAKPRLGRGLLGLMHSPSAISRPAEPDRDGA